MPFMPVLSKILLTKKEPSSSLNARMSALISIRKLSSSVCTSTVPHQHTSHESLKEDEACNQSVYGS